MLHLDLIVSRIFEISDVIKIKKLFSGGSSNIFNNAFPASCLGKQSLSESKIKCNLNLFFGIDKLILFLSIWFT